MMNMKLNLETDHDRDYRDWLVTLKSRYANRFYRLYRNLPQLVEDLVKVPWSP